MSTSATLKIAKEEEDEVRVKLKQNIFSTWLKYALSLCDPTKA